MRTLLTTLTLSALALGGCATQTPEQQLDPGTNTVRLCEGNNCTIAPRNIETFQGTPTDPEAERRLKALSDLGEKYPKAAYDLGLRYMRGDGVDQNSYQAIEWMRKAGSRGFMPAQLALGKIYLAGLEEMGSDPAEAESWLSRAAAQGSKEAKKLLPQAASAKRSEQDAYKVREYYRQYWGRWYYTITYYWVWSSSGWYLR